MTEMNLEACRARIKTLEAELEKERKKTKCIECDDSLAKFDCGVCDNSVCIECAARPVTLDNITRIDRDCEKCSKHCCEHCLCHCFDCASDGQNFKVYCINCSRLEKAVCKHNWLTCGEHVEETRNCCLKCVRNETTEFRQATNKRARHT